LNNRAWELKSFIDWEKFIQGISQLHYFID
jgi:hypothetical protein